MKIWREWCSVCDGSGHQLGCQCKGGAAFIIGCCQRCGGEGIVRVQSKGIIVTDYKQPVRPEDPDQ